MHASQRPVPGRLAVRSRKDWYSEPLDGLLVSFLCTEELLWRSFRVRQMPESCKHQPRLPTLYLPAPGRRDTFLSLVVLVRPIEGVSLPVPFTWDPRKAVFF